MESLVHHSDVMDMTHITPNYNSDMMNSYQTLNRLQNILQIQMIRNFSSGNFFIDTIIQLFIMTLVTYLMTKLKDILDMFIRYIGRTGYYIAKFFRLLTRRYKKDKVKIRKQIEIPYISDARQINDLYKSVSWYLTTHNEIDYEKETNLQYVYGGKISLENYDRIKQSLMGNMINKIPRQKNVNKIKYKTYEINYCMDTEIITIYTDREKKRENQKVTLWVEIDEFCKIDILEEFCQMCIVKYLESLMINKWEQKIFINKDGTWTSQNSNNTRKLDTIILKNSLKEEIKNDIDLFLNSEEWYTHRDIPYTRGYLFYGLPGTGKTSLIKGLSLHIKRHIHFLMLNEINSDGQLLELMKSINYKETILVIEDIDAMIEIVKSRDLQKPDTDNNNNNSDSDSDSDYDKKKKHKKSKKRQDNPNNNNVNDRPSYKYKDLQNIDSNGAQNVPKKSGVSLSGILNALDGIFNNSGRILIMTTNHPELLDDALIRPGRCDRKFLFDNCDRNQIKGLYEMFFNVTCPMNQLESIKSDFYSPAHLTSVFLRYRNEPNNALTHLDDIENKVVITPLISIETKDNTATQIIPTNINFVKSNDKMKCSDSQNNTQTRIQLEKSCSKKDLDVEKLSAIDNTIDELDFDPFNILEKNNCGQKSLISVY